jgi:uncharacterized cupin superfamily protein
MSKPVMNIDDVEVGREWSHGDRFEASFAPISSHIGAKKLAYNVTAVAPGKRAFPFHCHHTNEGLFFILEGEGTLRFRDTEYPVRQGDLIACPPGGPEVAHQLINTGGAELKYLALSTAIDTDVFQYPDSGKFGVVAGRTAGQRPDEAPFFGFYEEGARLDYWKGE